jgi:hypothetical protein
MNRRISFLIVLDNIVFLEDLCGGTSTFGNCDRNFGNL